MTVKYKSTKKLAKKDFEALSEFRYQLRRFLRFSESATSKEGLTSLQYLLLLHIKGFPGRQWATIGELAERLQTQHHGVVALISRCEENGLLERRENTDDRRCVEIHLLQKGETCLQRLAELHHTELSSLQKTFQVAHITSFNDEN